MPAESVTAGVPVKRLAEPRVVVPAVTFTTEAAEVTDKVRVALRLSVPAPRLMFRVPLFRSYVVAVRVPVPPSVPPESVSVPTVSLPPKVKVPAESVRAVVSSRRLVAEVMSVPPEILTVVAPMTPERVVVPLAEVRVPPPRLPLMVPPVRL